MQQSGSLTTGQKFKALFDAPVQRQDGSEGGISKRQPAEKETVRQQFEDQGTGQGGVYIISVAARILSMHPQTLRKYERVGLVSPSRTVGMLRLYSEEDIAKLRMIKHLVDELRLNLAGVEMALAVFDSLVSARRRMKSSPGASAKILDQTVEDILGLLQGRQPGRYGDQD